MIGVVRSVRPSPRGKSPMMGEGKPNNGSRYQRG
jgi:hypothetical protein